MSAPHLPAELLDHIVDHLHNVKYTLRVCGLVSKSWVPRARMHLFAEVWFNTKGDLESWKKTFQDPSTSPAHYTKILQINCAHIVTAADTGPSGWITTFSHVVHLKLGRYGKPIVPLLPFRYLILSFPLLEDLAVIGSHNVATDDNDGSTTQPLNPPMFTGTLKLVMMGIKLITRQLLSLPIHLRKIVLTWNLEEDLLSTAALVERCSHTLESLDIALGIDCDPFGLSILHLHPY